MRAWDFPHEIVIIECERCGRKGQYSKTRFVEIVGHHTSLPDARRIIAKDCERWSENVNLLHDTCKVGYPQLVTGTSAKK